MPTQTLDPALARPSHAGLRLPAVRTPSGHQLIESRRDGLGCHRQESRIASIRHEGATGMRPRTGPRPVPVAEGSCASACSPPRIAGLVRPARRSCCGAAASRNPTSGRRAACGVRAHARLAERPPLDLHPEHLEVVGDRELQLMLRPVVAVRRGACRAARPATASRRHLITPDVQVR